MLKRSINFIGHIIASLLVVYILHIMFGSCPKSSIYQNDLRQISKNKPIEYYPKGDWLRYTITHEIISNGFLCGTIINDNFIHSYDCIGFNRHDIITVKNGKFKKIYFV